MTYYVMVEKPPYEERWHDTFVVTFVVKSYGMWLHKVLVAFLPEKIRRAEARRHKRARKRQSRKMKERAKRMATRPAERVTTSAPDRVRPDRPTPGPGARKG